MSFEIIAIIPLVPVCLVFRNLVIRGGQIRKIKERSDQIISTFCGDGMIQISDATIDQHHLYQRTSSSVYFIPPTIYY